jgi:hypothetical protein
VVIGKGDASMGRTQIEEAIVFSKTATGIVQQILFLQSFFSVHWHLVNLIKFAFFPETILEELPFVQFIFFLD